MKLKNKSKARALATFSICDRTLLICCRLAVLRPASTRFLRVSSSTRATRRCRSASSCCRRAKWYLESERESNGE